MIGRLDRIMGIEEAFPLKGKAESAHPFYGIRSRFSPFSFFFFSLLPLIVSSSRDNKSSIFCFSFFSFDVIIGTRRTLETLDNFDAF